MYKKICKIMLVGVICFISAFGLGFILNNNNCSRENETNLEKYEKINYENNNYKKKNKKKPSYLH